VNFAIGCEIESVCANCARRNFGLIVLLLSHDAIHIKVKTTQIIVDEDRR
jgi:hypothetical protein